MTHWTAERQIGPALGLAIRQARRQMGRAGCVAGLTTALSLATASQAGAASAVSWSMDERSGSAMVAAGGRGPNGVIGSNVRLGVAAMYGTGYSFPAPAPNRSARPARLVTVSNGIGGAYLNPGSARITASVSLRTRGTGEYNLMQKGQSGNPGGFYKIEVNNNGRHPGRLSCTFGTRSRSFAVAYPTLVNDGRWHRVACTKSRTASGRLAIGVTVDRISRTGYFGAASFSISNAEPLSIGGKHSCDGRSVECDYFEGSLDQASVSIA